MHNSMHATIAAALLFASGVILAQKTTTLAELENDAGGSFVKVVESYYFAKSDRTETERV